MCMHEPAPPVWLLEVHALAVRLTTTLENGLATSRAGPPASRPGTHAHALLGAATLLLARPCAVSFPALLIMARA